MRYISNFEDFRCPVCDKLMFRFVLKGNMRIEIKCGRCDQISTLIVDRQVK